MIEFDHVRKQYPDGTVAVEDFSLTIPARSSVALVGSSGCGKTTLLRMINRMVTPTGGEVRIDGEDISKREPVQLRRHIGYVMQNSGLLPHRTVLQNIGTVLRLRGDSAADAKRRSLEMMEVVGLDTSLAQRYPSQLSGGQQQRVGVARGLAPDPNILLMDEPFGAVDPLVRAELQKETRRLQSELSKTIVFVTHDIDEAFAIGDNVVVLGRGGHIAQAGAPAELLANPANDFVAEFLGLGTGKRELHLEERNGVTIAVDGRGRPAGTIEGSPRPATETRP